MSEIVPDGWVTNDFSEIASNRRRKFQPKLDESEVVYVGLEHLESEARNIKEFGNSVDVISTKTRFFRGDTLFGKLRPYLKKVAYPDCDGICSTDILAIKPTTNTDSAFLYYVCSSDAFIENAVESSAGNIMPRASWGDLATFPIRFPPLPEQKKIASILTSVDEVIENTQKQIDKLQGLKKATMNELLTKGIGHTQFKDSPLGRIPKSWEVKGIGQIAEFVTSGSRGWAQYYSPNGAMFIRIGNLTRDNINLDMEDIVRVTPPKDGEGTRTRVSVGDVLVSITADLGVIGVVNSKIGEAYVNQHVSLVRLNNLTDKNPRWVGHYLSEQKCQKQFQVKNDGGAKAGLNLPTIRSIVICLPTLEEQNAITSIIDKFDSLIFEKRLKLQQTQSLKKSLMQDLLTGKVRVSV